MACRYQILTKKAMTLGTLKPKACKGCGQMFQPWSGFTKTCSPNCALKYTRDKADKLLAKQIRSEKMEMKARLLTRRDWLKKAQAAFNKFIRLRDQHQSCICCGKPLSAGGLTGGGYDAGHYRSVGSAPHLRFNLDNCHGQTKACNRYGSGRAVDYRLGLIKRIGLARVEALEADQEPRKYTIEELKEIERKYKALCKEIEKEYALQ